jgi:hypothetical protein
MIDLTEEEMRRYDVQLTAPQARAALDNIEFRMERGAYGVMHIEVLYEGKWRSLYRTDLMDDVGTTSSHMYTVAHYRDAIRFGARIKDDGFGVIDAYSDG